MNNRVTWLLPVKNGMPYLESTLASIQNQTYKNWLIIAWDNGSTDGSLELLNQWIPKRLPGKVIDDYPLPLGECLAAMVSHANTEFCARIDADDINNENRLEKQIEFLDKNKEVSVLGTRINYINENGELIQKGTFCPTNHDEIVNSLLRICAISHPSVIFRRETVIEAGNYRDIFVDGIRQPCEDYDLWLRMAVSYKFANLDIPLLNYRVHDKSTTRLTCFGETASQVLDECFCRNAKKLYGCSETDARQLRQWRHPAPIQQLKQIALHLDNNQQGNSANRLRTKSFNQAGRSMISSKKIIICFKWALYDPTGMSLISEVILYVNLLKYKVTTNLSKLVSKYIFFVKAMQ